MPLLRLVLSGFRAGAPGFQMPPDSSKPMIMVGPGSGIAPFRSFWQHRHAQLESEEKPFGRMVLYSGCRYRRWELHREEIRGMLAAGVLDRVHVAISREPGIEKTYVQDLLKRNSEEVYSDVIHRQGHVYVCGDCAMADDVYGTVREIVQTQAGISSQEAEAILGSLRVSTEYLETKYLMAQYLRYREENRYHEDIFGTALRRADERATQGRRRLSVANAGKRRSLEEPPRGAPSRSLAEEPFSTSPISNVSAENEKPQGFDETNLSDFV
ncbi:unnamed protein product [Darwinula stevensoni]|uniref:nitric-oxide synthase (NADPH) n=1 Tax=Darwinula stevensoni TaxID=69355 RepID=A0A7R9FSE9_9CRUS|nr:unnamed protein product [Darwinula stevensoni]CAG0903350.1 unnamed protein product [Darwinula stevensoni]